jgi:hypothetical protein
MEEKREIYKLSPIKVLLNAMYYNGILIVVRIG